MQVTVGVVCTTLGFVGSNRVPAFAVIIGTSGHGAILQEAPTLFNITLVDVIISKEGAMELQPMCTLSHN